MTLPLELSLAVVEAAKMRDAGVSGAPRHVAARWKARAALCAIAEDDTLAAANIPLEIREELGKGMAFARPEAALVKKVAEWLAKGELRKCRGHLTRALASTSQVVAMGGRAPPDDEMVMQIESVLASIPKEKKRDRNAPSGKRTATGKYPLIGADSPAGAFYRQVKTYRAPGLKRLRRSPIAVPRTFGAF